MRIGLFGPGMHDYVLRELEIGARAAMCEDSERCGWSALDDLAYVEQMTRGGCWTAADLEHAEWVPEDYEPHLQSGNDMSFPEPEPGPPRPTPTQSDPP